MRVVAAFFGVGVDVLPEGEGDFVDGDLAGLFELSGCVVQDLGGRQSGDVPWVASVVSVFRVASREDCGGRCGILVDFVEVAEGVDPDLHNV